jgi:flagellar export protein FliJ
LRQIPPQLDMKLFRFTLSKVLDYKQMVQRLEANILREMRENHQRLTRELDSLVSEYQKGKTCFLDKCRQGSMAGALKSEGLYLSYLQDSISQKKAELCKSELEIQAQIVRLTKIKTETASIERLKEKQLKAHRLLELKENEVLVDEFVCNTSLQPIFQQ